MSYIRGGSIFTFVEGESKDYIFADTKFNYIEDYDRLHNVNLIKKSDVFLAVLNNYGKDLTAEVGMAYAWDMPRIGIDYNAIKGDVMCYYALQEIIKPEELENTLSKFK